jgi:flagellar biogenesis protein FliO
LFVLIGFFFLNVWIFIKIWAKFSKSNEEN